MELVATNVGHGAVLSAAYNELWKAVQKLLACKMQPETLTVDVKQAVKNETLRLSFGTLEKPLVLWNVSNARGAPRTSGFDVYMVGTQYVGRRKVEGDDSEWVILRSEFQLLYLNALDRAAIQRHWKAETTGSAAYSGYRFVSNAVFPHAKNYPDCYVSYCLEGVPEAAIERRYCEKNDGWTVRSKHGQPHIPSAPMDLVAVLYMILHCHNPTSVENGWSKAVKATLGKLPRFALEADARSLPVNWYEHSHSPPEEGPAVGPPRWPKDFRMPRNAAAASWGARIWGHETVEEPHITINHGQNEKWRLKLRSGQVFEGSRDDIHRELLAELERTKSAWQDLWDAHYPGNKVINRDW